MRKPNTMRVRLGLMTAASLLVLAGPALAQADSDEDEQSLTLNSVTVTATKSEESLQDVPIAVTAVSAETIAQRGFTEVENLNSLAPSISINPLGSTAQTPIGIRGIQSSAVNPGFEPAVGVVIDGITRSRAGQALSDFLDVQRVEVLRGPQGTLFGKNTSAGVVSIVTNRPEFEFGGSASIQYGSYNFVRADGIVTGPLSDTVAFRLAATTTQRDGVLDLIAPGPSGDILEEDAINDRNRYSLKGQLLFEPNDNFDLLLIADYSNVDEVGTASVPTETGPLNVALITADGQYVPNTNGIERAVQLNTLPSDDVEDWGLTAEANWDVGPGTLTALASYREYERETILDLDAGGFDFLGPNPSSNVFETMTFEARYVGTTNNIDWLVGAYLFQDDLEYAEFVGVGPVVNILFGVDPTVLDLNGLGTQQNDTQESTGFALFTQNTLHVNDKLSITGGLRYSDTEKSGTHILNDAPIGTSINDPRCAVVGAVFTVFCDNVSFERDFDEAEVTGTLIASYQLNDDINTYASYSRGYKTGGINFDREALSTSSGTLTDFTTFDGEFVDAFELGLKSELFGGRSRVNVAAFYSDYSGLQISAFTGAGFIVLNADGLVSQGIEIETNTLLAEGVTFDFNATYLDAKFDDNLNPNDVNAAGDPLLGFASGNTLPAAPEWRFNGALNIEKDIPDTQLVGFGNVNFDWRDDQITVSTLNPLAEVEAYGLLGATIGIGAQDDRWRLSLIGSNLTDEVGPQFGFDAILQAGSFSGFLQNPESYRIKLDVNF